MTTKTEEAKIVEDISWNLRKDIRSICGTYDTIITDKLEKLLTQALATYKVSILSECEKCVPEEVPEFDEAPCQECSGNGWVADADHSPDCNGDCAHCPVQVQRQCPCGDGVIGFPNEEHIGYNTCRTQTLQAINSLKV